MNRGMNPFFCLKLINIEGVVDYNIMILTIKKTEVKI